MRDGPIILKHLIDEPRRRALGFRLLDSDTLLHKCIETDVPPLSGLGIVGCEVLFAAS